MQSVGSFYQNSAHDENRRDENASSKARHEEGAPLQEINRAFEEKEAKRKAKELNLAYIDIASIPVNLDLLYLLGLEEARAAIAIPFFRIGKKLRVAVARPTKPETITLLQRLRTKGYLLNITIASTTGILEKLEEMYSSEQYRVKEEIFNVVHEEELDAYEKEIENLAQLRSKFADISSEEALNMLNLGAFKTGASDIHFQPEAKYVIVRFRIDGVLQKIFEIDHKVFENIANQIKYKAKIKLNIQNIPQDGRYSFVINKKKIDVRVASLPTEFGESFVCRLLDAHKGIMTFEGLGFQTDVLEILKGTTELSHGMILVTGPTGSGKTTTLYSMLNVFNKPENKIITLEDPIEYYISNVTQSQINEKRGYDFVNGLRSLLRHDPDIVMIGEIRDLETAEVCAQAALTGHVLLTTLHTNSALEAIPRLVNMGLPPFMIAPTLNVIVAQRLVRKVCPKCNDISLMSRAEEEEITRVVSYIREIKPFLKISVPPQIAHARPDGCDFCSHTGYRGQIAVAEALEIDFEMKELILNKASSIKLIESSRRKGMITMREDGILKVLDLVTTIEEVHRVTNVLLNTYKGLSS